MACLLCLALLAGMLPMAALAAQDTHQPETYAGPTEPGWQGAGTENDPYQISTLADLAALRDAVNGGNNQNVTYFKMTANIDLRGEENPWESIGKGGKFFTGTFDGAGHTISGLYLNSNSIGGTDRGAGLFTSVGQDGSVKNLTVEGKIDPTGLERSSIGGVVGVNNGGTISSCTGSVVVNGGAGFHVGGVVGANSGGTISSCTGSVVINGNANFSVGGIVGSSESGTIEDCRNTGSIDVTGSGSISMTGISGIVGTNNGTVENCENTGKVTVGGKGLIGGIVGRANGGSTVSNCRNSGDISANMDSGITGGIVGKNYGAIFRCNNTGAVSADGATGGVAGQNICFQSGPNSIVENCYNTGAVSGSGDVGGVVGHNNNSENFDSKIKNCYNTGKVTGTDNLGGAVGRIETGDVSDCYYLDTSAAKGIGSVTDETGTKVENIDLKTAGQFASGEVAWLLQSGQTDNIWGQQLTGNNMDKYPVLTDNKNLSVLRVTFKVNETDETDETAYAYANFGAPVANWPADPTPSDGQYFAGWKDSEGKDFTAQTNVTSDNISVTASFGTIEQLASPTGLAWSGTAPGQATWSAVTNASGYTVQLYKDGSAQGSPVTVSGTSYDFQITEAGSYTFTVTATGSGAYSDSSASVQSAALHTVSFDTNGGTGTIPMQLVPAGGTATAPAAPTRSGYSFHGWYTAASGGEWWDFSKPVTADMTLYAQWSWINVGGPTYPPTMDEPENGAVTTSPSRPEEGDAVTITPKPDEGFEVDEILVKDENGKEIKVTQNPDGTYTFTQPDGKVTITVTFRCDGGELCPGHHLTDVRKDAWYHAAVDYVVEQGIMEGMSATTFSPNTEVTRAQAVQILYNLEGKPDLSDENLGYPYEDVDAQAWYGDAVYWARITGVATGYGDGTFQPGDNITRQEFAQMLYNYAKYKGYDLTTDGDLSQFPDSATVADWAEAAMIWANGNELINGHDNGTIDAGGTAIRAQAASILMQFDQNLVKN